MKKLILNFLLPFAVLLALTSSCVEDTPSRTAETEQQEIDKAIANLTSKGYNVDTTALGVYYVRMKNGTGAFPQTGDTCHLIYTGFYLDGTIFDASYYHSTDSIWKYVYKVNSVIPGFEDAVSLLNKSAAAYSIIPSELAYGPDGYYPIPPYTPLVFNIVMRDIKPKK